MKGCGQVLAPVALKESTLLFSHCSYTALSPATVCMERCLMESKEKSITGSCKDLFPGVVKNWIEQLHCLFSFKMDFGCWVVLPLCCRMYKGRGMRSRVKMVRLCVLPDTLIREWRLLWVDQVYIFSCGKAWQLFEHFYSQPWWRLGAAREEGAVCSTFVHSSPADCTCSARHQQPAIEAFWKPPSVRSRS